MKKKLSIVDIAKHLNVSTTTVSFILNGRAKEKRISDELKNKVLKFAKEVDYKPSSLARGLRTGKSNIIGLLVEDISNPFFASIARQIEESAGRSGYKILYSSTNNDTEKTKELIRLFKDRQVDGYIIAPPKDIEDEINSLISTGATVVLFDRDLSNVEADYVGIDGASGVYKAVQHLVSNGYSKIGFVTIDSLQSQMMDRLEGYKKAVTENNLTQYVKEISYSLNSADAVTELVAFFKDNTQLDAVVFATNYLAVRGLKAIALLGLKIPQQLAVLAFDELDLFELHSPTITTVAQSIEEIAEKVISVLLNRLNNSISKVQIIKLETSLIIRNSTTKKSTI